MADGENTYDTVHPAITDVVSRPMDNLVLVYGNSNRDTYNALAFQVVRSVRRYERVEDAFTLNANGGTREFGWFGESGFSRSTSNPGTEVFSIDSNRSKTIGEYGFAIHQDGVYVGIQTGDGATVDGLAEGDERGRGLDADQLPTRAGVLSDYTRAASPAASLDEPVPTTALSERYDQGLIRIDSKQDGNNRFFFAFNNQAGSNRTIDITAYGQTYNVRPIDDEQTARDMLAGNGYNRRVVQYGAFDNTNPNLPRDWYDYRVSVGPGELTP